MSGLKVLVVGASISGLTAAYLFAKDGAHVTVIEHFPRLRTEGHAGKWILLHSSTNRHKLP